MASRPPSGPPPQLLCIVLRFHLGRDLRQLILRWEVKGQDDRGEQLLRVGPDLGGRLEVLALQDRGHTYAVSTLR